VAQAHARLLEVQSQEKNAASKARRAQQLVTKGFLSPQERDDTQSALARTRAQVEGAQADLRKAKLNLSYTRIQAPFKGTTSSALYDEGSLISPPSNTPLTTLTQLDPLKVKFGLSEAALRLVQTQHKGPLDTLKATLTFADGALYPEKGKVIFVDSLIDPQTGTVELRALFPNPHRALRAGQFVKVHLTYGDLVPVFIIPQQAILQEPQGTFVFLATGEQKAQKRFVQGAPAQDGTFHVTHGLKAGERVVVEGFITLRDNAPLIPHTVELASLGHKGA
jgi:membrane fusion protein (multidrug efflux system)